MLLGCIMAIVSVCTLVESMRRCNKWCPENQQISQLRVPCQGPPLSSKTGFVSHIKRNLGDWGFRNSGCGLKKECVVFEWSSCS